MAASWKLHCSKAGHDQGRLWADSDVRRYGREAEVRCGCKMNLPKSRKRPLSLPISSRIIRCQSEIQEDRKGDYSSRLLNCDGNPPIFNGARMQNYAASFSFIAGVMPPMAMLGRSLLYVHSHCVACSCASSIVSKMFWSSHSWRTVRL